VTRGNGDRRIALAGDVSRLFEIAAHKRHELAAANAPARLAEVKDHARHEPPPLDFLGALRAPGFGVIAEIKRASPAAGTIDGSLDAAEQARRLAAAGVHALSVWTDQRYFGGYPEMVREMRAAAPLPLLRKDFFLDAYQVYESRALGADAIMLIAAILDVGTLRALREVAEALGMATAFSVHRDRDIETALDAGATTFFIHNRDVGSFDVDLGKTVSMRDLIPDEAFVVSESGITKAEDVLLIRDHVDGVLVGMGLMESGDPCAKVRELMEAGLG
jgi:indole-3-glycerol phosphate synthase